MKAYIVFDPVSGEILRSGNCPDSDLMLQDASGNVLEVTDAQQLHYDLSHYVVAGVMTAYTDDQFVAKSAFPMYPATWSNDTFTWTDNRDLDAVKLDQWTAVKAGRDQTVNGSFTWDGSVFDSNAYSQSQIGNAITLGQLAADAGQDYSINWTLQDNTVRTLTFDQIKAVGMALGVFVQTQFNLGVSLRQQIASATSIPAVQAITWTA
jgi:hypothetical protein